MTKTDNAIMEQILSDLKGLLKGSWDQISSMKDENEGRIKVSAAFLISFKGNEQAVKTTVTFGRRVSESRESIINPNQIALPLDGVNGAEPTEGAEAGAPEGFPEGRHPFKEGEPAESTEKPKKTRQKAAKEA